MVIVIFGSANQALAAEKALEDAGLDIDIVPPPPEFSNSGCGLAVELESGSASTAREILDQKHISYLRIIEKRTAYDD